MIKNRQRVIIKTLNVILLTFCVVMTSYANPVKTQIAIENAIKDFLIEQKIPVNDIQVTLTSSKKRLNLPLCQNTLKVRMPVGAKLLGHSNFIISCISSQSWKTRIAAHIDGKISVLVTRHPIPQKSLIRREDLQYAVRLYSQLNHGYFTSANILENMETRRSIKTGQVITPNLVKAQKLVLRGQNITIIAQRGNLNLRVKGKALMDGQHGQTIKVKNLSSQKILYARVISVGTVKVNF